MNPLDPKRTAVIAMDLQADIVGMLGAKAPPVLERASSVIAAARASGAMVIYVVVGFRPGYPEIDHASPMYERFGKSGRLQITVPGADIAEAVKPREGEPVVVKHRVGAFGGTDLEMILRANRIETLVLSGIATSGCVLSTVRHASDADYRLVVVEDACADGDDEVHRVLTQKIFPRQASVVAAREVVAALGAG